jgi:DNA-binding MarR family transcriptional regulator
VAGRDRLLEALARAGREQSNAIVMFHSAVAARLGLGATDEKILDLIDRHGAQTAGELGAQTGLAPSSITGALDRLEQRGFITRSRDPNDQRRTRVTLRPAAFEAAAGLFDGLADRLAVVYAGYSDEELTVILDFMQRAARAQHAATMDLTTESE